MKDGDKTTEFVKYTFDEGEKKNIAIEMALKVSELQTSEDEKKAIMSDFKSRIDGLQAAVNHAATKLNNGYEMRNIECRVVADYDLKKWFMYREDNGEIAKERKMSVDDLQRKFDE